VQKGEQRCLSTVPSDDLYLARRAREVQGRVCGTYGGSGECDQGGLEVGVVGSCYLGEGSTHAVSCQQH
jgi:hypothetical protein